MREYSVRDHLKEMLKDLDFKLLYELDRWKLDIAKKIIAYRIKHKLDQRQLAKQVGIAQSQVFKIESGELGSLEVLGKVLLEVGYSVRIHVSPLSGKTKNRLKKLLAEK